MDEKIERINLGNPTEQKLRKNWPEALESLFSILLCRQPYSSIPVKKNIERLIYLYIERYGTIIVHLTLKDFIRHKHGEMDEYPNYLQESFTEFVGSLGSIFGIKGAEEFSDMLIDEPDAYYVKVFKYYFWTIVLGRMKKYQFVNSRMINFISVPDYTYSDYINKVELFEQTERPTFSETGNAVEKKKLKEFAMLSGDAIAGIRRIIESDLINILQYKTISEYFDFIANLFNIENPNPYKLYISTTLIGNIRSFAFPKTLMPYGLQERIDELSLNGIQLRAFMFVFWMFVKYAPENLYKVYDETSVLTEKHSPVFPMTKYSPDVLDYSTIHQLVRFESTES